MFGRLFRAALFAGTLAGLTAAAFQLLEITPLILAAETYEETAPPAAAAHDHNAAAWIPADGIERTAYTLVFNLVTGFGFALLLNAALVLYRAAGGRLSLFNGALWGLAGFVSFALAPALGLLPVLPGAPEVDLLARQVWWIATAGATAAGIGLIVVALRGAVARRVSTAVLGVILLAAPHAIGAPVATEIETSLPADLAMRFAIASLMMAAVFWIVLGAASGWAQRRVT